MRLPRRIFLITSLAIALIGFRASAHQANDSWLSFSFTNNAVTGQWDIAISDLELALGLDDNDDGFISNDELHAHSEAINGFALAHLQARTDGVPRKIQITGQKIQNHLNGVYLALLLTMDRPAAPTKLEISCNLFFDINPQFLNRVLVDFQGQQQAVNLTAEKPTQTFELLAPNSTRQFFTFGREGVWHIWSGFDHILFLLALLLPSVLQRVEKGWLPVTDFRRALINVLKIVTAFTVAHSITLSLATLEIIQLPSRLTESAIAASVVIAAINNIFPIFQRREWMVAFGFGLIHGFGFASGLSDMGIMRQTLAVSIVGFNLGVETGQLAIVAIFLPTAYALRASWIYQRVTLAFGSSLIVFIASVWLIERAFNLKLAPF